jgi:hypothetical protein
MSTASMSTAHGPPFGAAEQASELSADHVVRYCLIERAISSERSATIFVSSPFSSSNRRNRLISDGIKPACFLHQLQRFASPISALPQGSQITPPSSACGKMKAICASMSFDRFMAVSRPTDRITRAAIAVRFAES